MNLGTKIVIKARESIGKGEIREPCESDSATTDQGKAGVAHNFLDEKAVRNRDGIA